jgi:hypothetical protein
VVRAYTPLDGHPLKVGDRVGIDGFAFPSDPRTAFGLPFRELRDASELGPTPAWLVCGRRGTWVLSVHGYHAPAGRCRTCSGWWPTRGLPPDRTRRRPIHSVTSSG